MNKNKLDHESPLIIQNQHFSNENSLAQYVEWDGKLLICQTSPRE